MKRQSLMRQTLVLSAANFMVRGMGFAMRIWLSRLLGAEAMGLMELASAAHMLWLAPLTGGLPMAVSRHTAQAQAAKDPQRMRQTLYAARRLAVCIAWPTLALLLIGMPLVARILGDVRTLPALYAYLPCLPILGLSAAYNGYCYGVGNTLPPALSELTEQGIRFLLCAVLVSVLPPLRAAYAAAVPVAALFLGEALGLVLVVRMLGIPRAPRRLKLPKGLTQKLWRLAFPMTCMRVSSTLMRTVNAALIPALLRFSGLGAAEATAQLGMIQGMAMPLILLPAVVTGALAMVSGPALAAREGDARAMSRLLKRVLLPTLLISLAAMAVVWLGAPLFAHRLYRQPELQALLRMLSPCVVLMGVQQVAGGMLAGLGQQRRALYASLSGALLTVLLNLLLTGRPAFRLTGIAIAMEAGQALTLMLSLRYVAGAVRRRLAPRGA